jgi:6-phosphogluconolactonase (cycloisomerase 2 family)
MRRALWVLIAAFALGVVIGSADRAEAKKGKTFLYLHDNAPGNPVIRGFEVDQAGLITELPGSPFDLPGTGGHCGGTCGTLTYLPARKLLFVTTRDLLTAFAVAKDGALTQVDSEPLPALGIGVGALKRGKRSFVYVSEFGQDRVRGFEVAADGSLTPVPNTPTDANDEPNGVIPMGGRLVVVNEGDTLTVFDVAADGSLTEVAGSPFDVPVSGFFYYAQVDPKGKHIYVPDASNPNPEIFVFGMNKQTGALTQLANSPFDTSVAFDRGLAVGKSKVYGAKGTTGQSVGFMTRAKDGSVTNQGGAVDPGIDQVDGLALTPKGKHLAVWSGLEDSVRVFAVAQDGTLTLTDENGVPLTVSNVPGSAFAQP